MRCGVSLRVFAEKRDKAGVRGRQTARQRAGGRPRHAGQRLAGAFLAGLAPRRALGKEHAHGGLRLARGERFGLIDAAVLEGLVEGRLRDLAEARLGQTHGDGRLGRHHLGHLARLAHHLLRPLDQIVDEADGVAFLGLHHAPGEREFDGAGQADARQHQHRTGDARDSGIDLGLTHAHAGWPTRTSVSMAA